jgi:hypothetical protein
MKAVVVVCAFMMVVGCSTIRERAIVVNGDSSIDSYPQPMDLFAPFLITTCAPSLTTFFMAADDFHTESDVWRFAYYNLDIMQSERFYVDKPYIEAYAELTKLSKANVEKLLADTQETPQYFIYAVAQEMAGKIMGSNMSYGEKTAAISKFYMVDSEALKAISDNNTAGLLDLIEYAKNSQAMVEI